MATCLRLDDARFLTLHTAWKRGLSSLHARRPSGLPSVGREPEKRCLPTRPRHRALVPRRNPPLPALRFYRLIDRRRESGNNSRILRLHRGRGARQRSALRLATDRGHPGGMQTCSELFALSRRLQWKMQRAINARSGRDKSELVFRTGPTANAFCV